MVVMGAALIYGFTVGDFSRQCPLRERKLKKDLEVL